MATKSMEPVELSVKEIGEIYGVKQSTAYKWRKWLVENSLTVTRENCDRINSREFNLSESKTVEVVSSALVVEEKKEEIQTRPEPAVNSNQMTALGITVGRLQEINSQVELEVQVTERLRELHQSKIQSQKSQELQTKIQEVNNLDPKNLEQMLANLGIAS